MTIYLTQELNWTITQAGLAMSTFGLGSVTGAFIGGWLTDRVGYYPTMFWALLIGGLSFFVLAEMTSFYPYCITVYIVSTINDAFRPANMASLGAYSTPENQNRSLSLIRLAINLGFAIGAGVAGIVAEYFGFKFLFIMDGITCILAAFYFRLVLKEKPDLEKKKEEVIVKKASESAYRDKLYLFFIFFILLNGIAFSQLWNTIPIYYTDNLNLSKDLYGWIMLSNGIIIFFIEMPVVYLCENRYNRISLTLVGCILIAFSFLAYNMTSIWQLAVTVSLLTVTFGEILAFPFSNAFALSRSKPGRRGEYMGLYSMSWSAATIIAPTLGTYIAETYSFSTLWYVMASIGGIASLGFFTLRFLLGKEKKPEPLAL